MRLWNVEWWSERPTPQIFSTELQRLEEFSAFGDANGGTELIV